MGARVLSNSHHVVINPAGKANSTKETNDSHSEDEEGKKTPDALTKTH